MNKAWQVWLVLGLIFLTGALSGGLVAYHVAKKYGPHPLPPPEEWGKGRYEHIAQVLALTPEQRQLVQPIVKRNIDELVKLRRQSMRTGREIIERMESEIAAQLTPDQKKKYQEVLEYRRNLLKQRQERGGRGERHPPGPPPPAAPPKTTGT